MIETKHGTIRVTYRRGRRNKGRVHTIVHFMPGMKPWDVADKVEFNKRGEVLSCPANVKVVTADTVNDSRDQFIKVEGRCKSISKALSYAGDLISREDKKEIWKELEGKIKLPTSKKDVKEED